MKHWTRMALAALVLSGWLVPIAGTEPEPQHGLEGLRQEMKTGMEYRRVIALEQLKRIGRPEAIGIMIESMLYDRSDIVRHTAQRLLENVPDDRIYPAILAALQDPRRWVRLSAIESLGLVRDPSAANALLLAAEAAPQDTGLVQQALDSLRAFVYRVEPSLGFELELEPFLQHRDRQVRETVVLILGVMGRPASLPGLLKAWEKADTRLRIRLTDGYANLGRVEAVPLLRPVLRQGNKDLLVHAIYALAQIQSFSVLPEIRECMQKQRDPRVRMACLYALIEIPDPDNVPAILKLLEDRDATVQHWAAYALGQLKARSAAPALEQQLLHPAGLVRASAAMALGELKVMSSAPVLWARLSDPKEWIEVKLAVVRALMALGDRTGRGALWTEFQQPSLGVDLRMTCALAWARLGDRSHQADLAEELGSNEFTRALAAALALAAQGDAQGEHALIKALEHALPPVRRYAILGLESLGDPLALKALAQVAQDDPDPVVQILCASALVNRGLTDYRVVLWNALDNRQEDVRSEAVIALGSRPDALTLQQLKWYLRREPSVPVRQTIQRVFRQWQE